MAFLSKSTWVSQHQKGKEHHSGF